MRLCYEGIGQWAATFAANQVAEGEAVKISDNGTVSACDAGDLICGVVLAVSHDGSGCTVQLGGMVQLPFTGEAPSTGYVTLAADGNGGVTANEAGRSYLVVEVDSTDNILTMVL